MYRQRNRSIDRSRVGGECVCVCVCLYVYMAHVSVCLRACMYLKLSIKSRSGVEPETYG